MGSSTANLHRRASTATPLRAESTSDVERLALSEVEDGDDGTRDDTLPASDVPPGPPPSGSVAGVPVTGLSSPGDPDVGAPIVDEAERYVLASEVARGGLGRVVRAHDKRLGRAVAVKELLTSRAEHIDRFLREARITARLEHPSIVPVHDLGTRDDGTPFYTMKLVSGRSLESLVRDRLTLTERLSLLPSLVAVADAIAYAHANGVMHRDLKPANVLIGAFGETLVIDWGLAKQIDTDNSRLDTLGRREVAIDSSDGLTMVGTVLGTPAYMPPEQAQGKDVDTRADVYSLGAILYFVLTGRAPYRSRSAARVVEKVLTGPPRPIEAIEPRAPSELVAIVRRAMARDPAARYEHASELAADLRRFQTGKLVEAHDYSLLDIFRRAMRAHRAVFGVAAAAALILTALGALSVHRIAGERDVANRERVQAAAQRNAAVAARREAEERGSALVLLHARSELREDPTAALAWLKRYPLVGADLTVVRDIADEAASRGVARSVIPTTYPVTSLAYSADGAYLAAGGRSNTVFLHDVVAARTWQLAGASAAVVDVALVSGSNQVLAQTAEGAVLQWSASAPGQAARELLRDGRCTAGLSVSPDGRTLLTPCRDGVARTWWLDGSALAELPHDRPITAATFAADGRVVTATDDGAVRVFTTGGDGRILARHGSAVTWLEADPAQLQVFSGAFDGTVRITSLDTASSVVLVGHTLTVTSGALDPTGRLLATGAEDRTVRLWDLDARTSRTMTLPGAARSVSFSPDGRRVAASGIDGTVRVWTLGDDQIELLGHRGPIWQVAFSPDGAGLATASEDASIRLWSLPEDRGRNIGQHESAAVAVAFSPDGTRIASAGREGAIGTWSRLTGEWSAAATGVPATDVAFVGNDRMVSSHDDGTVRAWRHGARGWEERVVGRHRGAALAVEPWRAGEEIVSIGEDGALWAWPASGGEGRELATLEAPMTALAVSTDGEAVAAGGKDGGVLLLDADGPRRLDGHSMLVRHLSFSPDGTRLASASYDGVIGVWDTASGARRQLRGHLGPVVATAFSPDGTVLASVGVDGLVRLWNPATGSLRESYRFGTAMTAVRFSPDGAFLIVAGRQAEMTMWNLQTGSAYTLGGHDSAVFGLDAAARGGLLTSSDERGNVRLWRLAADGGVPGRAPADGEALRQWLERATTAVIEDGNERIASPMARRARR